MREASYCALPPVRSPDMDLDLLGPPEGACWAARDDPGVTAGPSPGEPCSSLPSGLPPPRPSWHLTYLSRNNLG